MLWNIIFDDYFLSYWCIKYMLANNKVCNELKYYITDDIDIENFIVNFGDDKYLANKIKDEEIIEWYRFFKSEGRI